MPNRRQFVYKWKIWDNFIHNVEICVDKYLLFDKLRPTSSLSAPLFLLRPNINSTIKEVIHSYPQ